MKKVLAAALLCTVSTFAAWDKYPVKPAGKGEATVGVTYEMPAEKVSELNINLGARFSIIEGLEAALMFEPMFTVMNDHDGNDGPTGLRQPVIGVRYWLPMGVGVFVDVGIPFSGEDYKGGYYTFFQPGVQYSTNLSEQFKIGAEVGAKISLENGDSKVTPPMELGFGLGAEFSLGAVTPFVDLDFKMGLTKSKFDGEDAADAPGIGIFPEVGVIFEISEMLSVDVGVGFGIGEDWVGKDNTPISISANLSVNF
ncbi:MAG: transporter [Fibromonadales bacterium]|nr:transporter [Fibromonadales bacterium]